MNCGVSDNIVAEFFTSPDLQGRLNRQIELISGYELKLNTLADVDGANKFQISKIKEAKKTAESSIIYMSTSRYVNNIFENNPKYIADKMFDDLGSALKGLTSDEYDIYLSNLKNTNAYANLIDGVDAKDISNVLAFDSAMVHKFNGFKDLPKGDSEYLNVSDLGVGNSGYDIYRSMMYDIVYGNSIDAKAVYNKLKGTSKNTKGIINNATDANQIIESASNVRELEEAFLLSTDFVDENMVNLFVKKMSGYKYSGSRTSELEGFWNGMGNVIFNAGETTHRGDLLGLRNRAIVGREFLGETGIEYIKNDMAGFVSDVVKLRAGGSNATMTIGSKTFTKNDVDNLAYIVGDKLLQNEYIDKGYWTYRYSDLLNTTKASSIVGIKPNKGTDIFDGGEILYGDTLLSLLNKDGKTKAVSEHYLFDKNYFINAKGDGDDVFDIIRWDNSIRMGKPKGYINDIDGLKSKVDELKSKFDKSKGVKKKEMKDSDKINVMVRDTRAFNYIGKEISDVGNYINFSYPRDLSTSLMYKDGEVYAGIINKNIKDDIYNTFNKHGVEILDSSLLREPAGAGDSMIEKIFGIDNGVVKIANVFGVNSSDIASVKEVSATVKMIGSFDGKYITSIIDYGKELSKINTMSIDSLISEAKYLSDGGTLITKGLNIDDIRKAYFNYKFAETISNKDYALDLFLKHFSATKGDVITNINKKVELYNRLRRDLDISLTGFNDMFELVNKSYVDESMIYSNQFINSTITKNISEGDTAFNTPIELYRHIKNEVNIINETIAGKPITSKTVQDNINVKTEGTGIAVVENDMQLPPVKSDTIASYSKNIMYDSDGTKLAEDVTASYYELALGFKDELDTLFNGYAEHIDKILKSGSDDVNGGLLKLHSSFSYEMGKLESNMGSTIGMATSSKHKLYGFLSSIQYFDSADDLIKYTDNLQLQKSIIESNLDVAVGNISEANRVSDGLLPNGNIVHAGIIENGYNNAYDLNIKNGTPRTMESLDSLNTFKLREEILKQRGIYDSSLQTNGVGHVVHNAISPGVRASGFLDLYKLIETEFGTMMPKILHGNNPSLLSKGSPLSMANNNELLNTIFKSISDMYTEGGYKLGDDVLHISSDSGLNRKNIKIVVDDHITDLIHKEFDNYGVSKVDADKGLEVDSIDPVTLKNEYYNMFEPYSDFIPLPEKSIKAIGERVDIEGFDLDDFNAKYLGVQDNPSFQISIDYTDDYIETTTKIIDDMSNDSINGAIDSNADILAGGLTDLLFITPSRILSRDGASGESLIRLYNAGRDAGREASKQLNKIIPKNRKYSFDLSKDTDKFRVGLDKDLLYKSQLKYIELRKTGLRGDGLDGRLIKNNNTESQIAHSMAKYFHNYENALGGVMDTSKVGDDVFVKLEDTFLLIGRDKKGFIDEKVDLTKELSALESITANNNFLGVFNLKHAPETPIKDMTYKTYNSGRMTTSIGAKGVKEMSVAFNELMGTSLSGDEFLSVYQSLFGGKIFGWSEGINKMLSNINIAFKTTIGSAVIKTPLVIGLNVISGLTTGFVSGFARGKALTKGISYTDEKDIVDIMTKYGLVNEYADMSAAGFKQMFSEAEKIGGGSIRKGLLNMSMNGALANSISLISTNTNNVLDLILMGNYKIYSVHNAIQSIRGGGFLDTKDFLKFMENADEATKAKTIMELKSFTNRGFYSVLAAADGHMEKPVVSRLTGNMLGSVLSGVRQNITFLNGWGDGIIRSYSRGVLQTMDMGLYLVKNGLSSEAFADVGKFIRSTPEYDQFIRSASADIIMMAKGLRIARSDEDIYEDGDGVTWGDVWDAISVFTTIGNGVGASLAGQTIGKATEMANLEMQRNTGVNDYGYMSTRGTALTSSVFSRLFVNLKYLKPRWYAAYNFKSGDPAGDALLGLVDNAGAGMVNYMLEGAFDPNRLAYSTESKGEIPQLMGADIPEDKKMAYNSRIVGLIEAAKVGDMSTFYSSLLKSTMINTAFISPIKRLNSKDYLTRNEVIDVAHDDFSVISDILQGDTPEIKSADISEFKSIILNDDLLNYKYMQDWLSNKEIGKGNLYKDNGIASVYSLLGEDAVNTMYLQLSSVKGKAKDAKRFEILGAIHDIIDTHEESPILDLSKAIVTQTELSLKLESGEPSGSNLEKEKYYMQAYRDHYQRSIRNNPGAVLEWGIKKQDRENPSTKSKLFDKKGNINRMYEDYFLLELEAQKHIDNNDFQALDATFSSLAQSTKYAGYQLINDDDRTINEAAFNTFNRVTGGIIATGASRPEGETSALLSAAVGPFIKDIVDGYLRGQELGIGVTEGMKTFVDNMFYTESIMTDYISNLETGMSNFKGGSGASPKAIRSSFKSMSDEFSRMKGDFKQEVNLKQYDQIKFLVHSNDKSTFTKPKIKSYAPQKTGSLYETSIIKPDDKDIKRKIKPSKAFKFKK